MKQFFEPIKYENGEGKYEYIDTSIEETTSESSLESSPENSPESIYETVASDVEVQMSDNLNQSDAILVSYEDYSVGFQPLNILTEQGESSADMDFVEAEVEAEALSQIQNEAEAKTDQIIGETIEAVEQCDSVIYEDTFNENADIVITPTSSGLKEDIVLNEIPTETEFSYALTIKNVVPLLRRDGNVYFVDLNKGLLVYAIAAPSMYDSSEESIESNSISVSLTKVDDSTYQYILTPDREYLEKAVYPVVIDPTINTQAAGMIEDSYISSRYSGNNYCNDANLKIGYGSDLYISRGLIQISFPTNLAGNTITNAYYWAYQNYSGSSSPTIQLAQITSPWSASTVKWSNQPGLGPVYSEQTVQDVTAYAWGITSLVQGWQNGSIPNYGMYLKSSAESSNKYKRFYSSNSSTNPSYVAYDYVDTSAPAAPTKVYTSPNASTSWTNYTSYPVVYWENITDAGCSGLSYVQCSIDNGAWAYAGTGSSGNVQVNVGTSGIHTISVRGVDGAGNPGASNSVTYMLDAVPPSTPQPPTVSITDGAINSKNSAKINLTVNATTDQPSGCPASSYNVYMVKNSGSETLVYNHVSAGAQQQLTGLDDNSTYKFRVIAFDSFGLGSAASAYCTAVTAGDRTGPDITNAGFSIFPDTKTKLDTWTSGNPTISWGTIPDEGGGTTQLKYQVENGNWNKLRDYTANSNASVDMSSFLGGTYTIKVKAVDGTGNSSDTVSFTYNKDTKAPTASFDSSVNESVIPGNNGTECSIKISVNDDHLASWTLDYAKGTSPTSFPYNITSGTSNVEASTATWNISGLEQNRYYTLRLYSVDKAGNEVVTKAKVLYALDTNAVAAKLKLTIVDTTTQATINANSNISVGSVTTNIEPSSGVEPVTPVTYKLFVNDELADSPAFNPLEYKDGQWVYPEGSQVFLRMTGIDSSGDYYYSYGSYQGHKIVDVFDENNGLNGFEKNNIELNATTRLIELSQTSGVYSTNGYVISGKQTVNGLINHITLTADQNTPAGTGISYYLIYDGGVKEIYPNQSTEINVPTNDIYLKAVFTSDGTATPTISSWNLDVMYIAFGDAIVVSNDFVDNARGFKLNDTVHDESGTGSIKLYCTEPTHTYVSSGTVESTLRTIPGNAWEAFLSVSEITPDGTDIEYEISANGGAPSSWVPITPGNNANTDTWVPIPNDKRGNRIVLRATLKSNYGTATPTLESWSLQCRQTLTGSAYNIELIDAPDNLSTLVDANYMTLLRWEASNTKDVTYNIYRSTDPHFSTSTLIDSTTRNYYYDYNIQYNTTFYYRVTAVKAMTGSDGNVHNRESQPSNDAWATTVSEGELEEMLGLEDYWTYSGFETGGGTGYINVANGNLVYQTTDLVVPDPFLASVMKRTYNSMAGTKTAMGYGWDFSFNTCLLKEYDTDGENVVALVLKDGDGSFHKFVYDMTTGKYQDSIGTYMKLSTTYDPFENKIIEYKIERKDGIVYHFNADTMKLDSFNDSNGKTLTFRYDYRGNLSTITNNVGETITLSYLVDGAEPTDADYIYVNNNIDMLSTITWTQTSTTTPESVVYTYNYNEDDQLETVYSNISGETLCMQTFDYNENLDGNTATSENDFVVTDAENRITVVKETYSNGNYSVSQVYDPVKYNNSDTNPILTNYLNKNYTFNYADTDSDGNNDTTTVVNSQGVSMSYHYTKEGLLEIKTDAESNQITYTHNANYQVESMVYDNNFNGSSSTTTIKNTYDYDPSGNVTHIKAFSSIDNGVTFTALGSQTDYAYGDPNNPNKATSVTATNIDSNNTVYNIVTTYTYDSNGNILTAIVADGSTSNRNSIEKTTTYDYYTAGDPNGLKWQLKSVTDEYGCKTLYIYDSKGRVTDVQVYDNDGNYVKTTAHYTYDGFSRTDTVSQPYVTTASGVTDMKYDKYGRLELKVYADGTAEKWVYDLTGRLDVYSMGTADSNEFYPHNTTTYTYDLLGRLKTTTLEDNSTTTVEYGYWDYSSAIAGDESEKVTTIDAEGTKTIEYYDILGRLVRSAISDGTTEITTATYTCDNIGNVYKAVDNMGTITTVEYNMLGQQVGTIVDPFNSADGKSNLNIETNYTYDYLGNALTKTDVVYKSETNQANPEYITTSYDYDDLSRLIQVTEPNPDYVSGSTDPEKAQYIITKYYYDQEENVNGIDLIMNYTQDAEGYINETYFNELGQTVMSFNKGDTGDGDNDNSSTQEYQKIKYSYTDTNRDKNDALSLVDTVTRTDGTKEVYSYDEMGRTKRIDYYEVNATAISEYITYLYDDLGRVLTENSVTIENGVETPHQTSYTYDSMGRTLSVWEGTYNNDGTASKVTNGLDIEYAYNDVGQVTCINYNTGNSAERNLVYVYDGYGRIKEIHLALTDNPNTVVDETDDNVVRSYHYNPTTGVLEYVHDYREFATVTSGLGDYIQTTYAYNSAGKVWQVTYTDADYITTDNTTGITEQYTIGYDGRGDIISEQTDIDYSVTETATSMFKAYDYDSLGRLETSVSGDNDAGTTWTNWDNLTKYNYDLDGNRETMDNTTNGSTTSYAYDYNQFNQLTTVTKGTTTYETNIYDLCGNQLTDTIEDFLSVTVNGVTTAYDKTTSYDSNLRNQITSAEVTTPSADESTGAVTNDVADSSYTYNVGGQRMTKYEENDNTYAGDDTTKYFYTGDSILYTTNAYNELMTENILDPSGQIIASKRFDDDGDPATTYELANMYFFYHYDIRSSVTAIVRPDGTLMESYTYDEYGNQTWTEYDRNGDPVEVADEIFDNEVTYAGSITDTSTGLKYMGSRYYNSTTGTFLSQDTYTGNVYEPWTQHLYSYCGNNPTSFIDPTGHMRIEGGEPGDYNGKSKVLPKHYNRFWNQSDYFSGEWWRDNDKVKEAVTAYTTEADEKGGLNYNQPNAPIHKQVFMGILSGNYLYFPDDPYYNYSAIQDSATRMGLDIDPSNLQASDVQALYNANKDRISTYSPEYVRAMYNAIGEAVGYSYASSYYSDSGISTSTQCFIAGTLVLTEDGLKPIEEIKAGDYVLSEDTNTGKIALKHVVRTFVNEKDILIQVTVNGNTIKTTEGHRFWVEGEGWVHARDLKKGDVLRLESGENVAVKEVNRVELEAPVYVYNFEVQDWHTYFVAEDGVLVHNTGCGGNGTYEDAPYHTTGNSVKSARPIDGQAALDNSVAYSETSTGRVGVSNGQIVRLNQTSPGMYHGFVVEYSTLTNQMKTALNQAGLVNLKGKILP